MRIDLHCHTTASDGKLTPVEIVQRAHTMQIRYLSITDHDTMAGIEAAQQAAGKLPSSSPLHIIPGVEISCRWQSFEIHILGWQMDTKAAALVKLLEQQHVRRQERASQIAEKLQAAGVSQEALDKVAASSSDNLTRKHFADAMVTAGDVKDVESAFRRYLGKGNCAYVQPEWCSIEEAVAAIQGAGGYAGLAHPLAYQLSTKWLKRLLHEFSAAGGDALEVASGQQEKRQRQQLAELANDYKLKASAGSDFHGPSQWRELGRNLQLPEISEPVWQSWSLTE